MKNNIELKLFSHIEVVGLELWLYVFSVYINGQNIKQSETLSPGWVNKGWYPFLKDGTHPNGGEYIWYCYEQTLKDLLEIESVPGMAILKLKEYKNNGYGFAAMYDIILKLSKGYELKITGNKSILDNL